MTTRRTLAASTRALAALEKLRIETVRGGTVRLRTPNLHPLTHDYILGLQEAIEWMQGERSLALDELAEES